MLEIRFGQKSSNNKLFIQHGNMFYSLKRRENILTLSFKSPAF